MTKQSKIKPTEILKNQCVICEEIIDKPLDGNSTLIKKPLEKELNSPIGSMNYHLELWYERGFEGKRICRKCFWDKIEEVKNRPHSKFKKNEKDEIQSTL